jgi:hypothetical protein
MGSNMEIFEARVLGNILVFGMFTEVIAKTRHNSQNLIFQPKTEISPQNPCFKYFHVRTHPR